MSGTVTDLHSYLREHGTIDMRTAITIAHAIAIELGEAHQRGIVHGSVQPRNILLLGDSTQNMMVRVNWFDRHRTRGPESYHAPEWFQREKSTPATDVYELGCVLFETLTGCVPFVGDTPIVVALMHIQDAPVPPSRYTMNVSAPLEQIVLRCLEKAPGQRYQDGALLARALEVL